MGQAVCNGARIHKFENAVIGSTGGLSTQLHVQFAHFLPN